MKWWLKVDAFSLSNNPRYIVRFILISAKLFFCVLGSQPRPESTALSSQENSSSWILSAFKTRDRTTMLTFYKSLVRSRLEYCCPLEYLATRCVFLSVDYNLHSWRNYVFILVRNSVNIYFLQCPFRISRGNGQMG